LPFKAEVLYNCISNETPVPRPVKHIKRNYVELLYVGNYIQGKGQDLALISLNKALKKNPNIRLKFIGGDLGRKKNQAFFKTLCVIVERWNLKDKVQFCGPSNNINKEMQACDIVINFSESESFSMVCLEALSCGAPLIASRSGGPEEIIRHKVNGLLVENRNTEEMAEAITQLASNELLRLEFSRNARLDFEQKFNLERMTNRLKDIYQSSRTLKN
jgi:glycosyltransferase involved in cell wall biosynthesis